MTKADHSNDTHRQRGIFGSITRVTNSGLGSRARLVMAVLVMAALPRTDRCGAQPQPNSAAVDFAIAIHGGAGKAPSTAEWKQQRAKTLGDALRTGRQILRENGSSLDAVEAVIRILEDSPFFNAGKGAVFNATGQHELDASIMDGRTRACGAVGGVRTVRNPISLARRVMSDTRHILLVTEGAERFADEIGDDARIERVSNDFFSTSHQRLKLRRAQQQADAEQVDSKGTVGCVALDRHGSLAAGTSTGGLVNKKYGRVGDTPVIGAGTYADNRTCAVSCTGIGEDFMRGAVAFDVSARIAYRGDSLKDSVHAILRDTKYRVRGGIIAVARNGEIALQFNTPGMARAAADSTGRWEIHVTR